MTWSKFLPSSPLPYSTPPIPTPCPPQNLRIEQLWVLYPRIAASPTYDRESNASAIGRGAEVFETRRPGVARGPTAADRDDHALLCCGDVVCTEALSYVVGFKKSVIMRTYIHTHKFSWRGFRYERVS